MVLRKDVIERRLKYIFRLLNIKSKEVLKKKSYMYERFKELFKEGARVVVR